MAELGLNLHSVPHRGLARSDVRPPIDSHDAIETNSDAAVHPARLRMARRRPKRAPAAGKKGRRDTLALKGSDRLPVHDNLDLRAARESTNNATVIFQRRGNLVRGHARSRGFDCASHVQTFFLGTSVIVCAWIYPSRITYESTPSVTVWVSESADHSRKPTSRSTTTTL